MKRRVVLITSGSERVKTKFSPLHLKTHGAKAKQIIFSLPFNHPLTSKQAKTYLRQKVT